MKMIFPVEKIKAFPTSAHNFTIVVSNQNGNFFQDFSRFFQNSSKIGLGFNISAEIDDLEKEINWSWDWIGGITDGPIADFDMENGKLLIADTGAAQVNNPQISPTTFGNRRYKF